MTDEKTGKGKVIADLFEVLKPPARIEAHRYAVQAGDHRIELAIPVGLSPEERAKVAQWAEGIAADTRAPSAPGPDVPADAVWELWDAAKRCVAGEFLSHELLEAVVSTRAEDFAALKSTEAESCEPGAGLTAGPELPGLPWRSGLCRDYSDEYVAYIEDANGHHPDIDDGVVCDGIVHRVNNYPAALARVAELEAEVERLCGRLRCLSCARDVTPPAECDECDDRMEP